MGLPNNPPLSQFLSEWREEIVLAQVLIRRRDAGFELRHEADRLTDSKDLRPISRADLLPLSQFTDRGAFRPLRAAPNLSSGWCFHAPGEAELEEALDTLYPGALADRYAAAQPQVPVTSYREFTARQSGMYRITAQLPDAIAASVSRACCAPAHCLKQRLWTVPGAPSDEAAPKSLIPCLQPCAVLLEFARKAARIEQEEKIPSTWTASELATLQAALSRLALGAVEREADFAQPENPRRAQWLLEKLAPLLSAPGPTAEHEAE